MAGAARAPRVSIVAVRIDQVQRGLLLAARTGTWCEGPNGAYVAPVRDQFQMSVLVYQNRMVMAGIQQKVAVSGEVAGHLDVEHVHALVAEHLAFGLIRLEHD